MNPGRLRLWAALLLLAALVVALAPPAGRDASGVVGAVQRAGPAPAPPGDGSTAGSGRSWSVGRAAPQVLRIIPRRADADADAGQLWRLDPPAPTPAPASAPRVAAPPPAAAPAVPLAPVARPLPFRMLGRYADAERVGVILMGPDGQVLIAHVGDLLASDYRVETIAGNTMVLTYLPLKLQQSLDIGITP